MKPQDDTTLRLEQTEPAREARSVHAIRWLWPSTVPTTKLDKNRFSLGRSGEADVALDASGVSRMHAVVTRQGPVYAIADSSSTNGTFVNGERVEHAALAVNDVVRVGDLVGVVIRVRAHEDEAMADVTTIGDSLFGPGLAETLEVLQKAASSTLPVVLIGETGVGKESVASALHRLSGRTGPFHAVNCAALPTSLAEAELFGYKKGAFTGADQPSVGHLRAADGGTLLLDELAELSPSVQAKLLRTLQQSEVTPLGETRPVSVDVRVVSACQTPLLELVAAQRLREDLMMRLNGVTITLSPLRERRVDVGVLFEHFVRRFGGEKAFDVEPRALEQILLHSWPGNVRELELFTRKLLTLHSEAPQLRRSMLPESMESRRHSNSSPPEPIRPELDRKQHDLQALCRELAKTSGNVAAAASAIGISRQRAYRLMAGRSVEELLLSLDQTPER
jgi:transcriptional regulator with PAS, ATPase and Fis domain